MNAYKSIELFSWQNESIRDTLDSDIIPPTDVVFKQWDDTTLHACIPLHDAKACIILLNISAAQWSYHNFIVSLE
jgi:hypothetical protein